jgi:flavorubredoxin
MVRIGPVGGWFVTTTTTARRKDPPMRAPVPTTDPFQIAPETFVIPNLAPGAPGTYVPVNAMVIRGAEPVIVDTGAPVHREQWLEKVFSVVEPEDVRWIFLSHDDGDHTGGLLDALERCPNATLIGNFFIVERLSLEMELPLHRIRSVDHGEQFDAGDRTLHLFRPPIFDGPTTRGLYDPTTATMWIVDSFASMITDVDGLHDASAIPADVYGDTFRLFNSMVSPWHQWLDPAAYRRHVDDIEAMGVLTVASAHGGVHTGPAVHAAFERVCAMAGEPITPDPGQPALDEMLAASLLATEPVA